MPPGKKPCLFWNCKVLSSGGPYCPQHTPKWNWPTSKGIYHSKWWRQVRRTVLEDQPTCSICHKESSTEVDHIINVARGGADTRENLRGVCRDCHREKTKRESRLGHEQSRLASMSAGSRRIGHE